MVRVNQLLSIWKPLSRFKLFFFSLMAIPSLIFLFVQCAFLISMLASSHWMLWPDCLICTATALLLSPFFTARSCSLIRCVSVLPVSPMYSLPHSHGIEYTTPLWSRLFLGVLTFMRQLLSVLCREYCSNLNVFGLLLNLLTESLYIGQTQMFFTVPDFHRCFSQCLTFATTW